ncbi:sensor histidine kinase [Desulfocurvibacter africanus]|uniref:sensor histidine kinase n=1 Tax=Desulfocurvibacter africanus TaxID=873 RepID=UPI00041E6D1A|nr:HAMP domain-containing sensor histidine kinase [Desulfocurvibacter africanus]
MILGMPLNLVLVVDFLGSGVLVILGGASVAITLRLAAREPENPRWSYMGVLALALAAFALSRALGHMGKAVLLAMGRTDLWQELTPYSGALNTATFIIIAAVSFLYGKVEENVDLLRSYSQRLEHSYTALKDTYRDLQLQHQRMLILERKAVVSRIVTALAHETRNPLSSIAGFARILRRECGDQERPCQRLDIILDECSRLERLVDGILKTRHEAPLHFAQVLASDILDDTLRLSRTAAGSRGVTLRLEPGPPGLDLRADRESLAMALTELALNAIEASPRGAEVTLGAEDAESMVRFQVQDRGPGIPQEVLPKLFDGTYSTKPLASGLGLSFVRDIAGLHGGRAACSSPPGQGTTCTLSLPKVDAERAGRQAEQAHADCF